MQCNLLSCGEIHLLILKCIQKEECLTEGMLHIYLLNKGGKKKSSGGGEEKGKCEREGVLLSSLLLCKNTLTKSNLGLYIQVTNLSLVEVRARTQAGN